jgi:uncharacterized protein YdaU (DUF1376 family)
VKARLPYLPWFHGDFLRSTAGWSLLERAVYWMLLCAQWETGPLPDDLNRLAAVAGTDSATLAAVWPVVSKKFVRTRGGLANKRLAEHRRKVLDFRRRQSEGGKKGMRSRYGNASNVIGFPAGKDQPRG